MMALVTASETAVLISEISSTVGFKGITKAETVSLAKASFSDRASKFICISFFILKVLSMLFSIFRSVSILAPICTVFARI